ncbi:MAG: hybrid sensor histidine kinase/response regulator [Acidobacteria bacterium]|nr:hybrid sensor histidine kinase/response regulator [Acidobacteriota bacterium]
MSSDQDFLRQLLATFKVELDERLESLNKSLLELERGGGNTVELIDQIFRDAHSLKGAARAVEIQEMEEVAHAMEALLSDAKQGKVLDKTIFSLLYKTLDFFTTAMDARIGGGSVPEADVKGWVARLEKARHEGAAHDAKPAKRTRVPKVPPAVEHPQIPAPAIDAPPLPAPPPATAAPEPAILPPVPPRTGDDRRVGAEDRRRRDRRLDDALLAKETIRVSTSSLDSLLAQSGELLITKLKIVQLYDELSSIAGLSAHLEKSLAELRKVMRPSTDGGPGTKMLDGAHEKSRSITRTVKRFNKEFVADTVRLHMLTRELQEDIKKIRMLPVGLVFDNFYRMVRDLCEVKKKQVVMATEGGDCALDKKLIEALKDPMMHLIRNAVDHGIESPEIRAQRGKPPQGRILLSARQKGDTIIITVEDDGAGINVEAVKQKAVKKGLLKAEEADALSQRDMVAYIFKPGFSTAPIIDDISGRGIGLDVVHAGVEKMQGSIDVVTELGSGTKFVMQLPLTVSTFQGLLVKVGGQAFILPITSVEQIKRIAQNEIRKLGSIETIQIDGTPIQITRLAAVMGLPEPERGAQERLTAVIVSSAEKRIAFLVDGLMGEQEVILKNLSRPLLRVRNVAGASILGNGQIVMILNVSELVNATPGAPITARAVLPERRVRRKEGKTILVVDDSITTRMLEKNILETAGYHVLLATDGMEALGVLQTESVDLVLSDIEMPHMDGFNLTLKIRSSAQHKELPVILVTSLASPEDKTRGIEAGADAYIIKSSFDQGKLLQTIEQLTD